MAKIIRKIVVTGGPCAGKTTALNSIRKHFESEGWTVLTVPETATELISGGVAPWTCSENIEYQGYQISLQMKKEDIFVSAAKNMPKEKILIVCDRGVCGNHTYMTDDEYYKVLSDLNVSEDEIVSGYDGVFHLVTAAKGAEQFYTTSNNSARTETLEEAVRTDDREIRSWRMAKPEYYRIIDNDGSFENKISRLIKEIENLLSLSE